MPPFTYPLDIEVWADQAEDLEALFAALHEEDARAEDVQQEPEGAA